MAIGSWTTEFDWETPAGQALRKLAVALPSEIPFEITVFGSAPIQISIAPTLLSADVDVFCEHADLTEFVRRAGLDREQSDFHIQVGSGLNFRTSPLWGTRKQSVRLANCTFHFPHAIDILIAKLNRLEEKDLLAFRTVIGKTGHPTEGELLHELQMAVDLFRPGFDEEQGQDLGHNCRRLWPLLFGREIDPASEIIAPALRKRREGYGEPSRDYKQELREAAAAYQAQIPARRGDSPGE